MLGCYHPGGRLYWRRRRRWLTGPEVLAGHAFAPIRSTLDYTGRELLDLMGNSFTASSVMISAVSQWITAARLGRMFGADTAGGVLFLCAHAGEHPSWPELGPISFSLDQADIDNAEEALELALDSLAACALKDGEESD